MRGVAWASWVLVGVIASGCAATTAPARAPGLEVAPESELAPIPFSAEQIRDATRVGRTYVWAVEMGGKPAGQRKVRFTAVDEAGATMESSNLDPAGNVVGPVKTSTSTWAQLRRHASYPKDAVISDVVVEVPAGRFDCVLYSFTVEQEGKKVGNRVYFPKDFPGAPVKVEMTSDGAPSMMMTLLEHSTGDR
ncbi:hypothetical protein L6R52_32050 [Myxococcota bacterium]|nr:hypothetical protein [Myxococcota bacterium]